jgi:superfamily II helicase
VELLRSPRFVQAKSVIIYCMLQKQVRARSRAYLLVAYVLIACAQTEAVAGFLIGAGFDAAAYHAGKHNEERTRMQNLFFQNKLRIIVATGIMLPEPFRPFILVPYK